MELLNEYISEYKKQLETGIIQKAYRGLMGYITDLKTHIKNKYPEYFVSGGIYYGYMDMTYFSVIPESFKQRNLKVAIVFIHEKCRFEVWLAGINKQVQTTYWKLFKESGWNQYQLVPTTKGFDSILEYVIVDQPDFNTPDTLTEQIESGTLKFIQDVEDFLSNHKISTLK